MEKKLYIGILFLFLLSGLAAQEQTRIELLPINRKLTDELAPVMYKDGLVFLSNRKSSIVRRHYTEEQEHLFDYYIAEKKDSVKWGKVRPFAEGLTTVYNEGPVTFSADGNTVYFTRNMETGRRGRRVAENTLGLFTANFDGSSWVNIKAFAHNVDGYNTAHPALSKDGKLLFFASDRPGGFGKSDLYVCTLVNGSWSQPVNLGSQVNTAESELYPYYHESKRLYFASDRSGGMGGLDLYFTRRMNNQWQSPAPMAEPFNSRADDFALSADARFVNGFFTSNRQKTDDIYSFSTLVVRLDSCPRPEEEVLCYELYESNAVRFDTMPFIYEWDFGDGTTDRGIRTKHCFPGPGEYTIRLNVIDLIRDTIAYNEAQYYLNIERIEQPWITAADSCYAGDPVSLDASASYLPGWDIEEYIWSFDDGSNGSGIHTEKVFAAPGIYQVQLIVRSRPQADGTVRETCVSKAIIVEERKD